MAKYFSVGATNRTLETKVQRTQIGLEREPSKIADLELCNDFKRSNTDHSVRLERWADFETKGGEEKEKEARDALHSNQD